MGFFDIFKKKKTEQLDLEKFDEVLEFDKDLYQKNLKDHDWSHYEDDGFEEVQDENS